MYKIGIQFRKKSIIKHDAKSFRNTTQPLCTMALVWSAEENPSATYFIFVKIQNMESISLHTKNQLIEVVAMWGNCRIDISSIRV